MRPYLVPAALALAAVALSASAQPASAPAPAAPRPANPPLFSADLPDVPGKQLVVVKLTLPAGNAPKGPAHTHPGSVWVYITDGVARMGVEGQPVQTLKAGESFFEPEGAVHVVSESASPTEPAHAIAVMLVPKGAALATVVAAHAGH